MNTRPISVAVAVALVLVAGLTGCSHAPGISNGSVTVCYRAIPVGRTAIHDAGAKLVGIHRVSADHVRSRLPSGEQTTVALADDTTVCAMAFKGTFAAGQVDGAAPTEHGSYAIVLVTSNSLHLVKAFVVAKLPTSLGGRKL